MPFIRYTPGFYNQVDQLVFDEDDLYDVHSEIGKLRHLGVGQGGGDHRILLAVHGDGDGWSGAYRPPGPPSSPGGHGFALVIGGPGLLTGHAAKLAGIAQVLPNLLHHMGARGTASAKRLQVALVRPLA